MIELCKLTDKNLTTFNNFQWEVGKWSPKLSGKGDLCGPGWYHCYEHPLLAVLLNPIHARIKNPNLWIIETKGVPKLDSGLKRGYVSMRLIKEIPIPDITMNQKVAFGILCALEVYNEPNFKQWADDWLSVKNREKSAAEEARLAARATAWASRAKAWAARAAWAAAEAAEAAEAARAAWATAWEARATARAEWAEWAARATARAAWAEWAARSEWAEWAAAEAAEAARAEWAEWAAETSRVAAEAARATAWAARNKRLDLINIAQKALETV